MFRIMSTFVFNHTQHSKTNKTLATQYSYISRILLFIVTSATLLWWWIKNFFLILLSQRSPKERRLLTNTFFLLHWNFFFLICCNLFLRLRKLCFLTFFYKDIIHLLAKKPYSRRLKFTNPFSYLSSF